MARPGTRTTGRPTLNEVARLSGVSPITASRALRGVSTVAPALAERVRDAAASLGYVANPAARALASARSQSVVVLIPSLSNHLFIDTLEAIHEVFRPRGMEVLIGNYHYDEQEEDNLIRNYLAYQPCGMLLTGVQRRDSTRRMLAAAGVPCVHMMELSQDEGMACVGFSQEQAGAVAARHLLERGRKRLAYVAAQLDPRVLRRADGFRHTLAQAGLHDPSLEVMSPLPSSIGLGGELFRQLMECHPDVDGAFFCNDDLAHGAIFEAQRLGVKIPQQVAMVGFNDLPASAHMVPRLTSIRTPRAEIGRQAALMLLDRLDGRAPQTGPNDLGFELVIRES
ncbi:LacI family DNA-binding transcriptional regulator [Pseudomonas sp. RIT-PI-S]|uniref:LacI family DNA-binding transcriptional regulator n=1 Tax=Pseudomonas sp. RIT-PI-S TaxID=3035295 RepID=UPI0021DA825B|nr:LacI family DNA-binding transcriptional regulator [Pseudomonas sp. RIT-PI-S]